MRKRIAYILTTYPCASQTFIRNEVKMLKEQGLNIVIFAAQKGDDVEALPGMDVFYRPRLSSLRAMRVLLSFMVQNPLRFCRMIYIVSRYCFCHLYEGLSLIKNVSSICYFASLVHKLNLSHLHSGFMNWPGRIGYVLSRLYNVPCSLSVHSRDGFVEGGAVNRKVANAEFVICCSQTMTDYISARVTSQLRPKIHTIYHGASVDRSILESTSASHVRTLIAIGRFVPKKGFDRLLLAFRALQAECSHVQLVLVGDGPDRRKLEDYVIESKMQKHVFFTGWLDHSQTLERLSCADVLIVPSVQTPDNDRDGIPNVILEAFMLNVPVIASNVGGIPEAVIDRRSGLLVEPNDIVQLKDAIRSLLKDHSLRSQIIKGAQEHCSMNFDAGVHIRKLYSLFDGAAA